MKSHRMINLDVELIEKVNIENLNLSAFVTDSLYNYFAKQKGETATVEPGNIDKEIEDLESKKKEIEAKQVLQEKLKAAGMSEEKLRFLERMNTNILLAKDNCATWKNKFGESTNYSELMNLRRSWVNG